MSTQQKLIRTEFKNRIVAQLPGVNVLWAVRRELAESEFPAVNLFPGGDRPESNDDDHAKVHPRVYTIVAEITCLGRPEDDATDDLAVAVRKAVLPDDASGAVLSGMAKRITWTDQEWDGGEGDNPIAGTKLEFNVYYTWRPE